MKAIRRVHGRTQLDDVPKPGSLADGEVRIRVAVVGVCRTDIDVATGRLPVDEPRILGHELSGVVDGVGSGMGRFGVGDRVTVMPFVGCGLCEWCSASEWGVCPSATMLGVHRDGAFAEFVVVPAHQVYRIPEALGFREAAYAEPVAAALAVLRSGIRPGQRGFIYEKNRFSLLVEKLLQLRGFSDVRVLDWGDPSQAADGFDFGIETGVSRDSFGEMARLIRPRGTLVLKSRDPKPVAVPLGLVVRKELQLRAVHYGSFDEAVALLAEGQLDLGGLLGPVRPLEAFLDLLGGAEKDESVKMFVTPGTLPCVE